MASIENARYIPVLSVRPAEMNALLELPEGDKNLLLPAVQLRPWVGSAQFTRTIEKISDVYGERNWIGNLDCDYTPPDEETDRPAIHQFHALCNENNGYENWCRFVAENQRIIPCIQLRHKAEFLGQLERLAALERGLVVHLQNLSEILTAEELVALAEVSEENQILFIIDFKELGRRDLNEAILQWANFLDSATTAIPGCFIAISSTSFPHSFDSITTQEIRERQLFGVAQATNQQHNWNLIYSDRGSARLQIPRGGGGAPYPRIDYPVSNHWYFFRSDSQDGEYQGVAIQAMASPHWNPDLRIWGTQMIERTSRGDEYAIISPAKATAVRINIHLHRQLFYDAPDQMLETDDDWSD